MFRNCLIKVRKLHSQKLPSNLLLVFGPDYLEEAVPGDQIQGFTYARQVLSGAPSPHIPILKPGPGSGDENGITLTDNQGNSQVLDRQFKISSSVEQIESRYI